MKRFVMPDFQVLLIHKL